MVNLLPKLNQCVLDRLMYHLARIAHQVSLFFFLFVYFIIKF